MKTFFACLGCIVLFSCAKEKIAPATIEPVAVGTPSTQIQQTPTGTSPDCSHPFHHSNLCLSLTWETLPTDSDEGSFIFKVFRPNSYDQSPVLTSLPEIPNVVLWMPAMGHGSSPIEVAQLDTGTYRANHVYFVMPGIWEIHFQVRSQETVKDEAVLAFTDQ